MVAEQTAEEIEAEKELQAEIEAAADMAMAAPKAWSVNAKYLPEDVREGALKLIAERNIQSQIEALRKKLIKDELPKDIDKRLDTIVMSLNRIAKASQGIFTETDIEKERGSGSGSWRRYKDLTIPLPGGSDIAFTLRVRNK
jgi:acetyl-CoA acetyltransferase